MNAPAEQGDTNAQIRLGIYADDKIEKVKWWFIAKENGNTAQ